jgi:SAM-dependent methyltransferase
MATSGRGLLAAVLGACALAASIPVAQSSRLPLVGQPGKDVGWVPTPDALVDAMLDVAHVTPDDYLIDLGSGDGRTVIGAARRGARALGIEYEPDLVEVARERAAREGVDATARFERADLFATDLSSATVVTMFLLPEINLKLRPKLLALTPGTRIVSNTWDMDDWEADETATASKGCANWCTALLWIVPAPIAGHWRLGRDELTITQKFQRVRVTMAGRGLGRSRTATSATLRGTEIHFTIGGDRYAGRATGDVIDGIRRSASGVEQRWTATRTRR